MGNVFNYLLLVSLLLALVAIILSVVTFLKIKNINEKNKLLFAGKKAVDLEKIILQTAKKLEKLDSDIEDLFLASNKINKLSSKSLKKIGIIRFNPFGEKGHKNCFALCLKNSNKEGIVFSTLNTQEGTRVFVKRIIQGKADIPLTKEEESALKIAN